MARFLGEQFVSSVRDRLITDLACPACLSMRPGHPCRTERRHSTREPALVNSGGSLQVGRRHRTRPTCAGRPDPGPGTPPRPYRREVQRVSALGQRSATWASITM